MINSIKDELVGLIDLCDKGCGVGIEYSKNNKKILRIIKNLSAYQYVCVFEWVLTLVDTPYVLKLKGNFYDVHFVPNTKEFNFKVAMEYYLKSAQGGDTCAMVGIGLHFMKGRDGVTNYEEALSWFNKAANLGSGLAMVAIGLFYEKINLGFYNPNKSIEWYMKGVHQFEGTAMYAIGRNYLKGINNVKMNLEVAYEWFIKAAEHHNDKAMFTIGVMFYNGSGIEQNKSEAKKWYLKALEENKLDNINNPLLLYNFGILEMETGDIKMAIKYLVRALYFFTSTKWQDACKSLLKLIEMNYYEEFIGSIVEDKNKLDNVELEIKKIKQDNVEISFELLSKRVENNYVAAVSKILSSSINI